MTDHRVVLVSALDSSISQVGAMVLAPDFDSVFNLGLSGMTLEVSRLEPDAPTITMELRGECLTCALRAAIVSLVQERHVDAVSRAEATLTTVIVIPPSCELLHLCPGLDGELDELGIQLAPVVHLLNADAALDELLGCIHLDEVGLDLFDGDERCVAEVQYNNLAYADIVITLGDDEVGHELISHVHAPDSHVAHGLDAPLAEVLRGRHEPSIAIPRVHPALMSVNHGRQQHGTWTLDLVSDRPFHPGRLKEFVGELGSQDVCARGCFWLPSRPERVCSWESPGGSISVGDAGAWDDVEGTERHCHVVVTGVGHPERRKFVREAFDTILCLSDELNQDWSGDDGLRDWFGYSSVDI